MLSVSANSISQSSLYVISESLKSVGAEILMSLAFFKFLIWVNFFSRFTVTSSFLHGALVIHLENLSEAVV